MGTFANIHAALDTKLASLSGIPAVVWPNIRYMPAEGTTYLRPTLLPNNSDLATLTAYQLHRGIYQIDIFVALEKGPSAMLTLQDSIKAHFENGRRLTSGSDVIYIQAISPGQGRKDGAWYMGHVEINYICYS
jgi:hypothetical protein